MSIPNYIRPQLTIKQLLDTTPSAALDRLNPLVVGPNYHVEPYTAVPAVVGTSYLTAGLTVAFPNADTSEILDASSVRVFAKALDLAHATGTGTVPSLATSNVVKLTGTTVAAQGLQVGDIFISTHATAAGSRRTITGFQGADVASSYAQDGEAASNPLAVGTVAVVASPAHVDFLASVTGTFAGLVKGPMYAGYYGDLITLTCTTGGAPGTAVMSIRTASGLYNADAVPTTDSAGLYAITGYFDGLVLKLTKQGAIRNLVIGDVVTFQVKAPYALLSTSVLAITGAAYTGTADTTYLIKVTTGGAIGVAKVQVTDTAGIDVVQTYNTLASGGAQLLGTRGLSFTFTAPDASLQGGLRKGDVYAVSCVAATKSTSSFDKIVLSGPAIDITGLADGAITGWTSRISYTGEVLPKNTNTGVKTWTSASISGGVVFAASAKLGVTRSTGLAYFSMVNATGELFPSYRAIVPPGSGEGLLTITPDNVADLGDAVLANDLAYGVGRALAGAQGKAVYALRTGGLAAADFTAALNKVRNTDLTYALAILSDDLAVKQAAGAHVDSMSSEAVKNFRRAYVGTDIIGAYGAMVKTTGNTNYTATVISYNGGNKKVYSAAGGFTAAVAAGDLFRTNFSVDVWGDETYEQYVVDAVISDTELGLVTGPAAPVNPAARFEVWKADNAANQVSYLQQVSAAIANRRVANVCADQGTALVDGAITVISSKFIAAEIAGLRCALYPQQSLTNTEISTITAAANMYLKYSAADLDAISAAGVFVVTQDIDGGAVYIRHQLTTKTDKGSLYYEDSVGVNLDAISFAVKDILQGYIGKRNANSQTINEINKKLTLLLDKQVLTSPSVDVGPALISYSNLSVALDATLKDKINVLADLAMPLPLNTINVTLHGSTTL
jgi:hypothetical protein